MAENKPKLFLLDAYALIYRSYFAFIRNPRFNSKGVNTSAMLGVTNTIVQVLENEKPDYIGVVFDPSGPTFRHEQFPEYKAHREEMPEDLRKSIPYIRKIIEAFNIPSIEKPGFEADDVIGTLAKEAERQGFFTYMMTPDKDYAQLVTENIVMYKPGKSGDDAEVWGIKEIQENFGIQNPLQVIDILGLMGDSADNIPGCPGVGPKTAEKLIADFGSIDGVYQNISQIKGKLQENLIQFEQQVRLSRHLATIILDVPIEFNTKNLTREEYNKEALIRLFEEFEFRSLIQRLKLKEVAAATAPPQMNFQGTLFDMGMPEPTAPASSRDTIETVPHQYYLVETAMQRASLRAELSVQEAFCFDTETTGLETQSAEIVCLSFAFRNHEAYCVLIPDNQVEAQKVMNEFREIFADENITKIGQNIKYDMLMLSNYGIEVNGPLYDTMLAHYLIQPDLKHNLDLLCEVYLNYTKIPTELLIGKKGKNQKNMRDVPVHDLFNYSCEDADLTFQLVPVLNREMEKTECLPVFNKIETPLITVLSQMENTGVKIDSTVLRDYSKILKNQIEILEKEIFHLAGHEFNISSPKQLGEILFEELKIHESLKFNKNFKPKISKTYRYKTDIEYLKSLHDKHEIVEKIIKFKLANKNRLSNKDILLIEEKIFTIAGEKFNISSNKQLGEILFEKLKIIENPPKTISQQYSTGEEELNELQHEHPIIDKILEFRELEKLNATYVEALPLLVNEKTGRLHTSFNQTVAATGRLSSDKPNLQNIPIRTENGREIRKAFIPSDKEHTFLSADYSQIELRIMAALSGDEEMLKAFNDGKDIHAITASKIYKVAESQVDGEMRRRAKTANFGIIYGISAFGLSQRLNISRTEAKQLIDGYFENFPRIKEFMDNQIKLARNQGFVQTIKGRRRYLPDINSANAVVRGMAERNAINAPIQGSAADIIKIAMINIHRQFEALKIKSKMVLQVHDELNFDVLKTELEQVKQIVKTEMESAVDIGVMLTVEMNAAGNWLEAH